MVERFPHRQDSASDDGTFTIEADQGRGTGWLSSDGRVVTDYHVISNSRELHAVDNDGRRYKLGGNIKIDDISDLAVLEFVDGKPENKKSLELNSTPPNGKDKVFVAEPGRPGNVFAGEFVGLIPDIAANFRVNRIMALEPNLQPGDKEAASRFARRPLFATEFMKGPGPGFSGSPIKDEAGKVVGMVSSGLELMNRVKVDGAPAERIDALLRRSDAEDKFKYNLGYENGFSYYGKRFGQENDLLKAVDGALLGTALGGTYKLAQPASRTAVGTALLLPYLATQTWMDVTGFQGSTNERDSWKFGTGLASDSLALAAMVGRPFSQRLSSIALAGAVAGRVASELIPNHYSVQKVEPVGGQSKPFLEFILK